MQGSEVQAYYRRHASLYDATRWAFLVGRRRAVRALALGRTSHVLEIGCGTGRNFGLLLRELSPAEGTLTGLDFSGDMLDRAARRVAKERWPNVNLVRADASDFALPPRFDAVFICYALSMMPNYRDVLQQAHAHLRRDGRLVVHDFDRFDGWGPIGTAMRRLQRRNFVDTDRPIEQAVRDAFGNVEIRRRWGGYCYTAVAVRR
jgi:ubiquinone/menaquinone biosynthesis C-methylase UbiE